MSGELTSLLFLVVGLSMAITPWLAAGGQLIASRFDQQDVRSLLPAESEVIHLKNLSTAFTLPSPLYSILNNCKFFGVADR